MSTTAPIPGFASSNRPCGLRDFLASAGRICRDPRIVITGGERGTVSSSLIVAGGDVVLYHISGTPPAAITMNFGCSHRIGPSRLE